MPSTRPARSSATVEVSLPTYLGRESPKPSRVTGHRGTVSSDLLGGFWRLYRFEPISTHRTHEPSTRSHHILLLRLRGTHLRDVLDSQILPRVRIDHVCRQHGAGGFLFRPRGGELPHRPMGTAGAAADSLVRHSGNRGGAPRLVDAARLRSPRLDLRSIRGRADRDRAERRIDGGRVRPRSCSRCDLSSWRSFCCPRRS